MPLDLSQVLEIFPPDGAAPTRPHAQEPPTGLLPRLWQLGSLQVQVAVAYLRHLARGVLADAQGRRDSLAEAHLDAATAVVQGMGYLRGPLAKLGQTLGSLPGVAPEVWVDALADLHFQVPPMAPEVARRVVFDELGAEPEVLFAEWQDEAFAAASLGQVHRARLAGGEWVAVKVQYPGMARAVTSDFRALAAALAPLGVLGDTRGLAKGLAEYRSVIEAETDYMREAAATERAGALLADLGVVVPRVHRQLSTRRVLTTALVPGVHLEEYLAGDPDQAARDRAGAGLFSALTRLLLEGGMLYADPHPGNFLFLPDGRVGLIDFGAVRPLDPGEHDQAVLLFDRILAGGEAHMQAIRQIGSHPQDEALDPEHEACLRELARLSWDLYEHDRDESITATRVRELLEHTRSVRARYLLRGDEGTHALGITLRWAPGLLGTLRRLECKVNFRRALTEARSRAP